MMFALFSVLVTTVAAQQDHNSGIKNQWGVKPQTHQSTTPGWTNNNMPNLGNNTHQGAPGTRQGGQQHYNGNLSNTRGYQPQVNPPHRPDNSNEQGASGSSYRLNQPVNQGGVNGVLPSPRYAPGTAPR